MRRRFPLLLIIIGVLLLVYGLIGFKDKEPINKPEEQHKIVSGDKKIAMLLLHDCIDEEINEKNVVYKYNQQNSEFEVNYTYGENEISISTSDFVRYYVSRYEDGISFSENNSRQIKRITIEQVISVADELHYKTGNILSDDQMDKLFNILKETEIGTYVKRIEDDGFRMTEIYSYEKEKIEYVYRKGDMYFQIHSASNYLGIWAVYGYYPEKIDGTTLQKGDYYILDKTIHPTDEQLNKMRGIVGTFID